MVEKACPEVLLHYFKRFFLGNSKIAGRTAIPPRIKRYEEKYLADL